jgi:hypothetical protein
VPLRAGKDTWKIDKADGEYASILLATDGVYDIFFPYLLKGQPVEMYVPLLQYFLDNNTLKVSDKTLDAVGKEREDYLNSDTCSAITDDKTVRVLINGEVLPNFKEDSCVEPDWDALQLEWNKKAYPHLYKEEKTSEPEPVAIPSENENESAKLNKKRCFFGIQF